MSTQPFPRALPGSAALPALRAWLVRHREQLWVAGILLLAALAHGWNMFHFPYYESDEGTYVAQAWAVSHLGELAPYTYWYDHAPVGWFQIAAWAALTGGYFGFGEAVNSGRVLMLLMQIVATALVYLIVRAALTLDGTGRAPARDLRRWVAPAVVAASIAAATYALSAYGLYYRRRVILDNITTVWMLLSIALLLHGPLSLKKVWGSAAALGISVLSKELTIFLVPVLAWLVWQRSDRTQRWLASVGWLAIMGAIVSMYALMALLKGELFPSGTLLGGSHEHVSLLETLIFQGSRGKDGGLFDTGSFFWIMLRRWIDEEPLLVLAGTTAMAGCILLLPWRRVVGILGLCTAMLWLFLGRGGIVIEFYLVPLLPLLAINLAVLGGLLAGWVRQGTGHREQGTGQQNALRAARRLWPVVPAALAALCGFGVWKGLNGPNYGFNTSPLTLWTSTQADAQGDAVRWMRANLPPDSPMIIDQSLWLDLRDPAAGPTFPLAHYYWKVDRDPEIRDEVFGNSRENVAYIVTTPQLHKDVRYDELPLVAETLIHSEPVKSFDTGGWPVEVRKVRPLYPDAPVSAVLARTWATYKERFIVDGRVVDPGRDGDTTSEGQSYAMLRAVYANDRAAFDAVWAWTQANLQQPSGLLAWLYGSRDDGQPAVVDAGSATDADQDTALALLLAARRWGEPAYQTEAQRILDGIWEQATTVVAGRRTVVAGDWARGDATSDPVVNPSYFAPYAYRIFAEADPGRPWGELVDSGYALLERLDADPSLGGGRGLLPTWVAVDPASGEPRLTEDQAGAASFGYDGLRAPWRVTLDWLWFRDERAQIAMGRIGFLRETLEREGTLDAAYGLDGTPQAGHESLAMYAGVLPALLFSGGDQIAFQVFDQKLVAAYSDDGQTAYWGDPNNYYDQNWAWFTTALLDGSMGNLWAGEERLNWGRLVAQ